MNTEPSALSHVMAQPEGKPASAAQRPRPLSEFPAMAQAAAELLRTPTSLAELSLEDARCVVEYMWLVGYAAGVTVLVEGDSEHTGFMLLLLSGEVSVEAGGGATRGGQESALISVAGPGHLLGEMGVLDGAPRSTTCVAVSRVEAGALTRAALHKLIADQPTVGARLMAAVAQRLAERVRAADDQVRIYAQIAGKLQAEIDALRRELGR